MIDEPSLFPECRHFPEDVFERAKALIERYGQKGPMIAAIRSGDDLFDDEERAWWIEVSRACKCILHPQFIAMQE
jgi:hypothetical protein